MVSKLSDWEMSKIIKWSWVQVQFFFFPIFFFFFFFFFFFISEQDAKESLDYKIFEDDILVTMTGTKGKTDFFLYYQN
jgi:hypothetical protein